MACMTQIRHLDNYFNVVITIEHKGYAFYAGMIVRVCNLFTYTQCVCAYHFNMQFLFCYR